MHSKIMQLKNCDTASSSQTSISYSLDLHAASGLREADVNSLSA